MPNPRKVATDALFNIQKGSYINAELDKVRKIDSLTETDIRFISELVKGTVKNKINIDNLIKQNSSVKLNKISPFILCVLELGIYQIVYLTKVPHSAAVNECVKIIKNSSSKRLSGYVNAVLRSVIRNLENNKNTESELHIKYSYPQWLVNRWINNFGIEFTKELLDAFNKKAPVTLRANTLKTTAEELSAQLNERGFNAKVLKPELSQKLKCMVECDNLSNIDNLDLYKNGMFYIQDIASALSVLCAGVKEGDTVIDMCSAPGGKATFCAELMNNKGTIYAFDIYPNKVDKIKENAKRLGIDIINADLGDASVYNKNLDGIADVVLCDVPCSGLGILRKKPDIKFNRCEQDIKELADLGLKILSNASRYVKCGGVLLFSTCTIDKTENEENVKRFLNINKNFSLIEIDAINRENNGYYTTYPHIDGSDGFFVAKFIKTE